MEKLVYETLNKSDNLYEYLKIGDSKNKKIIFFHGLLGRPHFDKRFLECLSEDFYVISPKLPIKSTLEETVDYTVKFVEDMKLKDYSVSGVSLGGCIAIHHTSRLKRVNSFYPINPIIPSDSNLLELILNTRKVLYKAYLPWEMGEFPEILSPKNLIKIMNEALKTPLTLINLVKDISNYSFQSLNESKTPGKMFCAKRDAFFSLDKNTKREINKRYPNLEIISFKDAHLSHNHHPKELADKIKEHHKKL
tara:strand:+ start:585 stop:1334 length:750 start_codon:yes stop_codon:yes gene_type:complete